MYVGCRSTRVLGLFSWEANSLGMCTPFVSLAASGVIARGTEGQYVYLFFDALCRCDNIHICLLSLNKREQLPTVDPLARASMKTVAKRDSVL